MLCQPGDVHPGSCIFRNVKAEQNVPGRLTKERWVEKICSFLSFVERSGSAAKKHMPIESWRCFFARCAVEDQCEQPCRILEIAVGKLDDSGRDSRLAV